MGKNTAKSSKLIQHWVVDLEESTVHAVVTLKAFGKRAIDGKAYAAFFCPAGLAREKTMKEIRDILLRIEAAEK